MNRFTETTSAYSKGQSVLKKVDNIEERIQCAPSSVMNAPELRDVDLHLPMIAHNFCYSYVGSFVHPKHFTLNKLGLKLINSAIPDFRYLFSFFSRYKKEPDYDSTILQETLSPFMYYRFLKLFNDFISYMPISDEREALIYVLKFCYVEFARLMMIRTFSDLRDKLVSKFSEKCSNISSFDSIFEKVFLRTITFPLLKGAQRIQKAIRKNLNKTKEEMSDAFPDYDLHNNVILANTFVFDRINQMETSYFLPREQIYDIKGLKNKALNRASELLKSGILADFKKFNGNYVFKVRVEPFTKFYLELSMMQNNYTICIDKKNKTLLVPVPENDFGITLVVDGKKVKSYTFFASQKAIELTDSFDRNGARFTFSIAMVKEKGPYFKIDDHLFHDNVLVYECFDYLIQHLVHTWVSNLEERPELQYIITVIDFALKYSIPTSSVFIKMLEHLHRVFSASFSFLSAFVPVYILCKSLQSESLLLPMELETLEIMESRLVEQLKECYVTLLSKPDPHSAPPFCELTILLYLGHPDIAKADEYLARILDEVESEILRPCLSLLDMQSMDHPSPPSMIKLYALKCKINQEVIDNSLLNIQFSPVSISDCANSIYESVVNLKGVLTDPSTPLFYKVDDILTYVKTLVRNLSEAFMDHDPLPTQYDIFHYMATHRALYHFLDKTPLLSPSEFFGRVILDWVTDLGQNLIKWIDKSVERDKFDVFNQTDNTSLSICDLVNIIDDTSKFILDVEDKSDQYEHILCAFVSLLSAATKHYISSLVYCIEKRTYTINQVYVMLNNLSKIKAHWNNFYELKILTKDDLPEELKSMSLDPAKNLVTLIKTQIVNLSDVISDKAFNVVHKTLFEGKSIKSDYKIFRYTVINDVFSLYQDSLNCIDILQPNFHSYVYLYVLKGLEQGLVRVLEQFHSHRDEEAFNDVVDILYVSLMGVFEDFPDDIRQLHLGEISQLKWAHTLTRYTDNEPDVTFDELMNQDQNDDELNRIKFVVLYQKAKSLVDIGIARIGLRKYRVV